MHKRLLFKILPIISILILIVLAGCSTQTTPKGWSGVAVSNGNLFVGSMDGRLVGVNTADRTRLFSDITLAGTPSGGGFLGCAPAATHVAIYSSPQVSNGLVYVGGYNGKVYAYTTDGKARWVYPREGVISPIVGGIAQSQGNLYYGDSSGKVYALAADTGDTQWNVPFSTRGKIWGSPLVDNGTVYIGSFDKSLYAIDAAQGNLKWKYDTAGAIVTTPVAHNAKIYFGSFDRYFYAVDPVDGKLRWRSATLAGNWFWAAPVVANNLVYAPNLDGKVYVFDAETGNQAAEPIDLGGPISSSPVAGENKIVLATEKGQIWVIDTNTNSKQLISDLNKQVNSPLTLSQDVVYIHVPDEIQSFNIKTGASQLPLPLAAIK